jgi:hypothetical protein
MTTKTTFEWVKDSDGIYSLQTPSDAVLTCTLVQDDMGYAQLFFGPGETAQPDRSGWYVREEDLDYLIGALTDIKEKVYKK